jgi:hypothetical protein
MSSLTEQERIGLEEVFLSISASPNVFQRCSLWSKNLSLLIKGKHPVLPAILSGSTVFGQKNNRKPNKITKLLNKIQKRRKF